MSAGPRPLPCLFRLPDGRVLARYEFGDPAGVPCIYVPGTPESGLAGGCYHAAAAAAGVRWISVDKPGYGHSDPLPNRKLLDWPADVTALADHLNLDRFAIAGESGGGPHALAVSYVLAERLTTTILLASMGPGEEKWVRQGMRWSNVLIFWVVANAPWLTRPPLAALAFLMRRPDRFATLLSRTVANLPAADRRAAADPEYAIRHEAELDAYRQGSRPAAEEMRIFGRPWGFRLADVKSPVQLWHGTDDVNVPFAVAEAMLAELPDATGHFLTGQAHAVGFVDRAAVMQAVARQNGR